MAKYLLEVNYPAESLKAILSKGGTDRVKAATAAIESAGAKVESFYFAFGATDAYVIIDAPDNVSAAALALTVSASGGAAISTAVLLTPEEIDKAAKKKVDYTPPKA